MDPTQSQKIEFQPFYLYGCQNIQTPISKKNFLELENIDDDDDNDDPVIGVVPLSGKDIAKIIEILFYSVIFYKQKKIQQKNFTIILKRVLKQVIKSFFITKFFFCNFC